MSLCPHRWLSGKVCAQVAPPKKSSESDLRLAPSEVSHPTNLLDAPETLPPEPSGHARAEKRITIRSVAEAAGVSIATVSFVINNRPGQVISEPVRKRVLETAKRLNYAPSAAAAGLARKQTTNVSIFFYRNDHLITNQLYSFVIQGAIKEATAREYNVLFSFIHDEYQGYAELPKVIREKNAEGALFIQAASEPLFLELKNRELEAVAVDCHPAVPGLDIVYADNDLGARLACRHLVELGHRQIAFLHAYPDRPSIRERMSAFTEEMRRLGLPTQDGRQLLEATGINFEAGVKRTSQALLEQPELTGIFCANDELAASVIRAASQLGRKVPDDLSVIGFDDLFMARCLNPPVTTIRYDAEEMGRQAMGRLIDLIEHKGRTRGSLKAPPARLPVELLERGSTGRVPQL